MSNIVFPKDFLWGSATASYQVEGGVHEGGRGETIWDRFSRTPGKVYQGQTGDIACDHYHRYREDIAQMSELGLRAYRFSIAWARLFPTGKGKLNAAGLSFYQRLVEELLAAGIVPMATLYHWDLPQALQDQGGWQNRDTAEYFRDYAARVFETLGDQVKLWITHNEPWVAAFTAHYEGRHAPGIRDFSAALQVSHHLLLSHALAVQAFREAGDPDGKIGITLNLNPCYCDQDTDEARQAIQFAEGYYNRWFLDPVFHGRYPRDMWQFFQAQYGAPRLAAGDTDILATSGKSDFLGVNYYSPTRLRPTGKPEWPFANVPADSGRVKTTEMGWEVYPQGLYDLLTRLQKDYDPLLLYVTENGAACRDERTADGRIEDDDRLEYLRDHFVQAHRAMRDGVRLGGYCVWSLMDNFEWAQGYSKRFGLLYVDYPSQKRIWKKSAGWYRDVIRENGFSSEQE